VAIYRLYLKNESGVILCREDFDAESRDGAAKIAWALCDACSDICQSFELWQGDHRIHCAGTPIATLTARDLGVYTQGIVIERELAIRDSRWLVAESKRLIAKIEEWSDAGRRP
jgi:hypothetical protein